VLPTRILRLLLCSVDASTPLSFPITLVKNLALVIIKPTNHNSIHSQIFLIPDIEPKEMEIEATSFWLQKVNQLFQQDDGLRGWYSCQQEEDNRLHFLLQDLVNVTLIFSPWWSRPDLFYTYVGTLAAQDRGK